MKRLLRFMTVVSGALALIALCACRPDDLPAREDRAALTAEKTQTGAPGELLGEGETSGNSESADAGKEIVTDTWTVTYAANDYRASDLFEPVTVEKKLSEEAEFEVKAKIGYKFIGWDDGIETAQRKDGVEHDGKTFTALFEYDYYNLPVFHVETEGKAITSKEEYVGCTVSLRNTEETYRIEAAQAGIRLRGNSTMNYPKKPYRIKFEEKKALFGWPKNKSWVLLALYADYSDIKDYTAFALADAIKGSAFVPHAKHVELYLNGEFQGIYLLCDQVDENKGRTGVKEDFGEEDEVPFLVEWDENAYNEGALGVDYFKIYNEDSGVTSYYNVKYPEEDERLTNEQFTYVQNYIERVNRLCHERITTRKLFEKYVDLDAFIDYYLVQEVMSQVEINFKSIYMSKAVGGKLVMGPIWDFDWSAGGPIGGNYDGSSERTTFWSVSNWFIYMLKKDWFVDAVKERWAEVVPIFQKRIEELKDYKDQIQRSAERNEEIWREEEDKDLKQFDEYYDWVLGFLPRRIGYIDTIFHKMV